MSKIILSTKYFLVSFARVFGFFMPPKKGELEALYLQAAMRIVKKYIKTPIQTTREYQELKIRLFLENKKTIP